MRKFLKAAAAVAMGVASAIAPQITNANEAATQQSPATEKRDAVSKSYDVPKPVEQRRNFTNGATGKDADRFLNQRQYRKRLRQCPWIRKSKKCRVK